MRTIRIEIMEYCIENHKPKKIYSNIYNNKLIKKIKQIIEEAKKEEEKQ